MTWYFTLDLRFGFQNKERHQRYSCLYPQWRGFYDKWIHSIAVLVALIYCKVDLKFKINNMKIFRSGLLSKAYDKIHNKTVVTVETFISNNLLRTHYCNNWEPPTYSFPSQTRVWSKRSSHRPHIFLQGHNLLAVPNWYLQWECVDHDICRSEAHQNLP